MSYLSTSRYIEEQESDKMVGTPRTDTSRYVNVSSYVVGYGDRLDQIAARLYGDPTRWWEIAEVNPEIAYPGKLPVGAVIRIPVT